MEVSAVDGEVRADQVAFRIGPRINAVGRLEDATVGVKLLLCEDKKTARQLARELDAANESRKSLEDDITQEALAIIEEQDLAQNHRSLVVCREHWHSGVVGIVASRLVEKHYLPSIVLTRDKEGLKGSARSIRGLHLVKALQQCEGLLEKFGGHAYAAGLSLKKENLAEFTRRFDEVTRSSLSEENFSPALQLDAESEMALIDPQLLEQLHRLEPFGLGNPAPLLMLKGVTVRESRIVGERHLRLQVEESGRLLGAIGFRLAEKQPSVASQVDLAFIPEWNEWNGNKNIQLRIIDLRAAKK
jgi:single-stranded-DNA-specific exonuclease